VKILVYPHRLDVGGSQINAIELAGAVRDRGHDVVVLAMRGPLRGMVADLGLPMWDVPWLRGTRPSLRVARLIASIVGDEGIDVVHAWEPNPCVESFAGATVVRGVPVVGSLMGFWVPRFLPRPMFLTVGTDEMRSRPQVRERGRVELLEPPIDVEANHPRHPAVDFRKRYRLDGELLIVLVSRLAGHLKLEGIERAMRAVGAISSSVSVRLAVVGDGEQASRVRALADELNATASSTVITLTGELLDPRPAYAAADLVIGMGSSSLRAMAFGKPVIVVGERGFSEIVEPSTVGRFLSGGFYGLGDGDISPMRLADQIRRLAADAALRADLGSFGRSLVEERFALAASAARLEDLYRRAVAEPILARSRVAGMVAMPTRLATDRVLRKAHRHAPPRAMVER